MGWELLRWAGSYWGGLGVTGWAESNLGRHCIYGGGLGVTGKRV